MNLSKRKIDYQYDKKARRKEMSILLKIYISTRQIPNLKEAYPLWNLKQNKQDKHFYLGQKLLKKTK